MVNILTFILIASVVIILSMRNHHAERITQNIIDLLKAERKKQALSHQKLADLAGVHRSTISLIESGKMIPTILVCIKISMALGVSFDALVTNAVNAEEA